MFELIGVVLALIFFANAYVLYQVVHFRKQYEEEMQEMRMAVHMAAPIKLKSVAPSVKPVKDDKVMTGLYVEDPSGGGMILADDMPKESVQKMSDDELKELQEQSRFKRLG